MQRKFWGRGVAAVVALMAVCLVTSVARSDDEKKPAGNAAAGSGGGTSMDYSKLTPEQQKEMMKQYMELSKPGPEHQRLKDMVGDWDADCKFFKPDGSPQGTSKGIMHIKPILGDRFITMDFDGKMDMPGMGPMPFHGKALSGYDKGKKKYCNVWIDDMGTGMMITEGTCEGDTLTTEGTMTDPMSGMPCKVKEVSTHTDKDHAKYEMWGSDPGQEKMYRMMEINYTRKM